MILLTKFEVLALHRRSLEGFGGSDGIRDEGAFESALVAVENRIIYDQIDVLACAATYAYHLTMAHAFVDGNKRVAAATMRVFLFANEVELQTTEDELYDLFIGIASEKYPAKPSSSGSEIAPSRAPDRRRALSCSNAAARTFGSASRSWRTRASCSRRSGVRRSEAAPSAAAAGAAVFGRFVGLPPLVDTLGAGDRDAGVDHQVDHRPGAFAQQGDQRIVRPADPAGGGGGRAGEGAAQRLDLGAGVPGRPHGAADRVEAALLLELADLELAGEAQGFGDVSPGQVVFKA